MKKKTLFKKDAILEEQILTVFQAGELMDSIERQKNGTPSLIGCFPKEIYSKSDMERIAKNIAKIKEAENNHSIEVNYEAEFFGETIDKNLPIDADYAKNTITMYDFVTWAVSEKIIFADIIQEAVDKKFPAIKTIKRGKEITSRKLTNDKFKKYTKAPLVDLPAIVIMILGLEPYFNYDDDLACLGYLEKNKKFTDYGPRKILAQAIDADTIEDLNLIKSDIYNENTGESNFTIRVKPKEFLEWAGKVGFNLPMLANKPTEKELTPKERTTLMLLIYEMSKKYGYSPKGNSEVTGKLKIALEQSGLSLSEKTIREKLKESWTVAEEQKW